MTQPPSSVLLAAQQMLEELSCELSLGDTKLVEGWCLETHTIGCRNHADTPQELWWEEHWEIYEEYCQDGISTLVGDPDSGMFASLTPARM